MADNTFKPIHQPEGTDGIFSDADGESRASSVVLLTFPSDRDRSTPSSSNNSLNEKHHMINTQSRPYNSNLSRSSSRNSNDRRNSNGTGSSLSPSQLRTKYKRHRKSIDNSNSNTINNATTSSTPLHQNPPPSYSNPNSQSNSNANPVDCSNAIDPKYLQRRSSSAMRVRELRNVLSSMTEVASGGGVGGEGQGKEEVVVSGSQNARLLVASQQCLVSRLQDLRHELDSMDNEVARVRADVMSSRRYFSAMTGIPCGPDWPKSSQQMDSAYTSPITFSCRSSDGSPYNSDDSMIPTTNFHHSHRHYNNAGSTNTSNIASRSGSIDMEATPSYFQNLQHFEDPSAKSAQLTRSDSCSSFMSWRSDVELAGVFPDEPLPVPVHVAPQKPFARYN